MANGVYSTTAEGSTSSDQTMMEFRGVPAFREHGLTSVSDGMIYFL